MLEVDSSKDLWDWLSNECFSRVVPRTKRVKFKMFNAYTG